MMKAQVHVTFGCGWSRGAFRGAVMVLQQLLFFQLLAVLCLQLNTNTASVVVVVDAWGKQGHEIVGNLASVLLSGGTLAKVAKLLLQPQQHETNNESNRNTMSSSKDCEEYCSPLANVADWADQIRYRYHWSAALHYIDVRDDLVATSTTDVSGRMPAAVAGGKNGCPAAPHHGTDQCFFNYTRDCPNDNCVAGAIVNYTQQLYKNYNDSNNDTNINNGNRNMSAAVNLKESLMFLVHFVGDIHQPLHCARQTDRGGNSIHVRYHVSDDDSGNSTEAVGASVADEEEEKKHHRHLRRFLGDKLQQQHPSIYHSSLNLHAVWDDSIIETTLERDHNGSRNSLEASLLDYIWSTRVTPTWHNEWLKCPDGGRTECTTLWGEESWERAMRYAYANVDGTSSEIVDGTVLGRAYYESRLPVVRERLAVAAVRLAATLELIFGDDDDGSADATTATTTTTIAAAGMPTTNLDEQPGAQQEQPARLEGSDTASTLLSVV